MSPTSNQGASGASPRKKTIFPNAVWIRLQSMWRFWVLPTSAAARAIFEYLCSFDVQLARQLLDKIIEAFDTSSCFKIDPVCARWFNVSALCHCPSSSSPGLVIRLAHCVIDTKFVTMRMPLLKCCSVPKGCIVCRAATIACLKGRGHTHWYVVPPPCLSCMSDKYRLFPLLPAVRSLTDAQQISPTYFLCSKLG